MALAVTRDPLEWVMRSVVTLTKDRQIGSLALEAGQELGKRLCGTTWHTDGCQKTCAWEAAVIRGDHLRGQEERVFVQGQRPVVLMHDERGRVDIHGHWCA